MRVTVLGCWSPMPRTGGACAGYLVEQGETHVLLDCGHAVSSFLGNHIDYNRLDAIVLTHLHDDHQADVYALRQAIAIDIRLGLRRGPLPVWSLGEPEAEWQRLQMPFALETHRYAPGDSFTIGELSFTTAPTIHALPCAAQRIAAGGRVFVFSGDTAPAPAVTELARGADLFICEATYRKPGDGPAGIHLAAGEAGAMATAAGVKRLLLTHFHPRQDPEQTVAIAREAYAGPCEAVREGRTYEV
jgi:ribonuclease BN (tRNA processing enzyme)